MKTNKKIRVAIYPGSFDPFTNGHLDILKRALKLFDQVIIAVTSARGKDALFSLEERLEMLKKAVKKMPGVSAEKFSGLLVDYAKTKKAIAIIRGLRAVSDFEYEFQMALMNRKLSSMNAHQHFETVYLMPDEKYTYLSSSLVKQVARLNGDIKDFVPELVKKELVKKITALSK